MKRTLVRYTIFVLVMILCASAFFACATEEPDEQEKRSGVVDEKNTEKEIESTDIIDNESFSGKMVFIKGLGACFISSADNVCELKQIKGLDADSYKELKLADSVVVFGKVISDGKELIKIRASRIELANNDDTFDWSEAERDILEKYDIVDSYAEAQYETPLGDRASSDPKIAELLALTDAKVKSEYGIDNLDIYSVIISEHASKPQKTVRYDLYLGGYLTYEEYSVVIDNNGVVLNCSATHVGDYSRFLPYFTIEKLQNAEEKLRGKASEYGSKSATYLMIDSEGQLCLGFEAIVNIDPPKVQFVNGMIIDSGCDIDHKHVFESEIICGIDR